MKIHITTFVLVFALFTSVSSFAKIWRVNNTGNPGDFTTIQNAHNDANVLAGDTLHIEPSVVSYGALTMTKKLIILGPGYFLLQNPNNQFHNLSAKVHGISFNGGSSGSVIAGLEITTTIYIRVNQIAILRCNFNGQAININHNGNSALNNILINGNYSVTLNDNYNSYVVTNLLISNNYIKGLDYGGNVSATLDNNIFHDITGNALKISNSVLKNNILYNYSGAFQFTNCSFYNNLDTLSNVPVGNGNLRAVSMSTVFVGGAGTSTDGQWVLSENSPAKGAGVEGIDCGIFGGSNPYKLSGLPAIPSIYFLNVPASSNGNNLQVTVSIKSNN